MVNTPRKKCLLQLERLEARDCPTAGALDLDFGSAGFANADFNALRGEYAGSIAIQPDGKSVVAGFAYQQPNKKSSLPQDFALARFNVNGTLDTSFGIGGKVLTDFGSNLEEAFEVAIVTEAGPNFGKIVVAGASGGKIAVARYNTNGSHDTSFDRDGKVTTNLPGGALSSGATAIVPMPGGKILVGVYWASASGTNAGFALLRYNANGSLDTSFDGDGISLPAITTSGLASVIGSPHVSLARLDDGRIIAAGQLINGYPRIATLALYNANGSFDTSFGGGDGHVEFTGGDGWNDVAVQSGLIVVVGTPHTAPLEDPIRQPMIARYDMTGALDMSFGIDGLVVETSSPFDGLYHSLAIQADGKIVAAGGTSTTIGAGTPPTKFIVARYSADGALDTSSFGTDDSDGIDGIVVTDTSTTPPTYNVGAAIDMAIQADGKIVVAAARATDASGNYFFAVARYLGDGPAPLHAAATPIKISNQTVTQTDIAPLLTEAIRRWQSAGFDISPLTNIQVRIADLPGTTLGQAQGTTITLDANAAGWGWFVDRTPADDSEFTTPPLYPPLAKGGNGGVGEQNRMDLLTALGHEIGHLLGHDHDESGVMADTLASGVRRLPMAGTDWLAAVEAVFYESSSLKRRA